MPLRILGFELFLSLFIIIGCKGKKPPTPSKVLPQFESGVPVGVVSDRNLDELSGMVASKQHQGMFWVHNDSGDENRIFLIDEKAQLHSTYYLNNTINRDWEDMAQANIGGVNFLFIGDIGDNDFGYQNQYFIYKVKEPSVLAAQNTVQTLTNIETIPFTYADGSHDAEAMFIDQKTFDIYLITKRGARARVYKIAYPYQTNTNNTAVFIRDLEFGGELISIPAGATAADISPDNTEIFIKSYFQVYYWLLNTNETVEQAMRRKYDTTLPYIQKQQEEAICVKANGDGYYTISETTPANQVVRLYYYNKK